MKAYIAKALEEGLCDAGGKWIAICEAHSTLVNAETRKALAGISTKEFCDCCRANCHEQCNNCEKVGA